MNLEYRVAHVTERLAEGPCSELGVRAEIRGETVLLTGTVPSARCREDIRRVAHEELPGVPVHCDLVIAESRPPDHCEELA
ncbi:BON domain-containing protein [Streptomyces sp. FXJ1.172]|uniref:BON domain-containing protein n=1 Tax=Streptomyces sp. FXJ1.172 TaxID=710705 RepID=UPI0007D02D75|nr:BON domain-containing protein [Streptomyces sp. FXJ1.172]WEO93101.1 BON domain-containing protein [Streptomyces sp. FXJ1.172]